MTTKFTMAKRRMFHADQHAFVFLAEDNTIYQIDERIEAVVTQSGVAGEFTKEDLFARTDLPGAAVDDLFNELVQGRVIVPATAPVAGPSIDFGEISVDLNTLVLHVTDACNLGCRYCYLGNGEHADTQGCETMSLEVAEQAIDFLLAHSGRQDQVVIVFFGGEPLLNLDLISAVVSSARKKAGQSGKKVDFALTTNATLLSDSTIAFLQENNIGVTVSIDGFEAQHDRFRRFANGAPTYQSILPGLKNLLSQKGEKPVVARVTVAGSAGQIPERLDHLLSLGFAEAGFAPVTTGDPAFQLDAHEMTHLLDQFRTLAKRFVAKARQNEFYGFTNLVDNLVVLHEGERKDYPCGAGLGLFSVDPRGRLYLCQRMTGDNAALMGDVFTGFDEAKLAAFREKTFLAAKSECRDCWVRKICAGGCYHEALVREGSLSKPNLHYCEWIKDWMQVGLSVYGRLITECPDYLDKLSMLRGHEPLYAQPI